MATVRFSQQLQDDIVRNAERMFDDSIRQATENYPKTGVRNCMTVCSQQISKQR